MTRIAKGNQVLTTPLIQWEFFFQRWTTLVLKLVKEHKFYHMAEIISSVLGRKSKTGPEPAI